MSSVSTSVHPARPRWLFAVAAIIVLGIVLGFLNRKQLRLLRGAPDKTSAPAGHDHSSHGHSASEADHEADRIEVTAVAKKAIGIQVKTAKLQPFARTISVPGILVERSGRSTLQVTAPMTGIITKIMPTEGEAVTPGQVLFELRLMHEEVVQSQVDLLRTAEELDVIGREILRLEKAISQNTIPGKTLLERQYEQQRQQAVLRSQRQALLLHGFDDSQIDGILNSRKLVQYLTIRAPMAAAKAAGDEQEVLLQVQRLQTAVGQYVTGGQTLTTLADHRELYIEGNAFERDLTSVQNVQASEQAITAVLEGEGKQAEMISDLRLLYVSSQVDPVERTVHFYVPLPNSVGNDTTLADGRRYVSWKHRPGQRAQLEVPVETWSRRIVLPESALVQDGPQTYAFVAHDTHFDRRTVQIEFKNPLAAVLAEGGGIEPGDRVVMQGAKQLWLALKNKSGGAIDPHAGHTH